MNKNNNFNHFILNYTPDGMDLPDEGYSVSDVRVSGDIVSNAFELLSGLNFDEPTYIKINCFHLTMGKAVIGIPLLEMADSFLVAASVIIERTESKHLRLYPAFTGNLVRMYKSNIIGQSLVTDSNKRLYHEYLRNKFYSVMPEFFNRDRLAYIDDFNREFDSTTNSTLQVKDSSDSLEKPSDFEPSASKDSFYSVDLSEEIH